MWKLEVWTSKDYEAFVGCLKEQEDIPYREFHSRLIPGTEQLIGIRTPKMREIAKEIAGGDYVSFLQQSEQYFRKGSFYYEQAVIEGMVIGYCCGRKTKDIAQIKAYIAGFAPKIDNWAVCDIFCGGIKVIGKHPQDFRDFILHYTESKEPFKVRMGIVLLMSYYLTDEYVEEVLLRCDRIKTEEYYVNMAIAWLISVAYVKFKEKTLDYLEKNDLTKFTYNKALQKIIESNRVSAEEKKFIRSIRRA